MYFLTSDNTADTVQAIVEKISTGLRAARDNGMIVRIPDYIDVEFVYLVEANAFESNMTDSDPGSTATTTSSTPEVIETTVDTQSSTGTKTDSDQTSDSNSENYKPPGQTTRTGKDGDQKSEQNNFYEKDA